MPLNQNNNRDIYSVSRLNREVRTILETGFPLLWIEAELSNFARPASGHWYFSLKDKAAQVKCAMFKNKNQLVKVLPENGKQVLVRARIGLYEPRGDYQLLIEHMEEAGDGALHREFDLLKNKLSNEGLFDASNKQELPTHATRVGIITSSSGAAIHDILSTLKRRYPMESTIIYPTPVQGKGACNKIAMAIEKANYRNETDVLIIARGGGALEDLWEFNEEVVARAIFKSKIPIISGVGHEVDFTIADFVADHRAATPTAAAEMISPDRYQYIKKLSSIKSRLDYLAQYNLQQKQQQIDWLQKRLRHPKEKLQLFQNRLNALSLRNIQFIQNKLRSAKLNSDNLSHKLLQYSPQNKIQKSKIEFNNIHSRFKFSTNKLLDAKKQKLQHLAYTLDALSPLNTLKRGYAIIKDQEDHIIRETKDVKKNQVITIQLNNGQITSTITDIKND
ncbi:MAG: exodeoxyribonuclease VII large subunit [Woeseiaceae bacterium]